VRLTIKALVSLSLVMALSAPAAPVAAQDETDPNAVRMTLAECLTRAVENNLDLRIAKLDPDAARHQVTFLDAVFDPVLGAQAGYGESDTSTTTTLNDGVNPVTSTDSDNTDSGLDGSLSLAQRLKFGGDYLVGVSASDRSSSGDSFDPNTGFFTRSSSDPQNFTVFLTFRMPLLKGFGKEVNTEGVILAKNDVRISDEELKRRAEVTIKTVEDAYWDVAAARAAVGVSKQSLKLAQDLFDLNKKKVEVGTLAPIEITQAEAGVASREEGVIVAENVLRNTEDNLRRLMAVPPEDPLWDKTILPADKPKSEPSAIDLDSAISTALTERAEIKNAKTQLESDQLSSRVAEKGIRHQLDLRVDVNTVRFDQLSRTEVLNVAIPPTIADVDGKTEPDWRVGLVYSYPFRNRAAKAGAAIAKINEERSQIGIESAEQDVRVDVRTAVRAVQSGAQRVQAAHSNTVLQQKTVDAELKKFENGMSTSFEVLRIQTDLSDAQLAEIRAILDYNRALADLERAKGTLLASKGLSMGTNGGR